MISDRGHAGRPVDTIEGAVAAVDARVIGDLLSGARDLAASVIAPDLGRAERLNRAERATAAASGVRAWVGALDPYRNREHSRVADLLATRGHRGYAHLDTREAADRLQLAEAHDQLTQQLRATSDLSNVYAPGRADQLAPLVALDDACPLLDMAAPITYGEGPAAKTPGPWSDVPDAVIGWTDPQAETVPQLDEISAPMLAARWGFNVALQASAMAPGFAAEYEALARHQVRVSLEAQLVASLTAAGVAAATLEAAECAVGVVWAAGPSLVLVSGEDAPKVRRAYAADFPDPADRPIIRPSAGCATGTALVIAGPGIRTEFGGVRWTVVDSPRVLGRDVLAYGYGRASVRIPGAVQLVTVA